jgi:hypothetical protein
VVQSPACKNVSMEAEDIVEAVTRQRSMNTAGGENLIVCCIELPSVN